MILTKYVMHRGKKKPVSELSKNSTHKVEVQCPLCKEVRTTYYRSTLKAGHTICQPCSVRKAKEVPLNVGEKCGRLTILGIGEKGGYSKVKCDCGNVVEKDNWNVETGKTRSCGCLRAENMKRVGVYPTDKDHWNWKGGIASERERAMQSKEYKDWRKEVFERGNHTCQICGQVGYKLNAHHLDNYAEFPEVRTELTNGTTLCEGCHNSFHSIYGYGCTKEDYVDFTKGENYD